MYWFSTLKTRREPQDIFNYIIQNPSLPLLQTKYLYKIPFRLAQVCGYQRGSIFYRSWRLESVFWKFQKYLLKENLKLSSCKLDIVIEFSFPTIIHARSVMFKRQELTDGRRVWESGARDTEKLFTKCSGFVEFRSDVRGSNPASGVKASDDTIPLNWHTRLLSMFRVKYSSATTIDHSN